jgi:hypothetical protein
VVAGKIPRFWADLQIECLDIVIDYILSTPYSYKLSKSYFRRVVAYLCRFTSIRVHHIDLSIRIIFSLASIEAIFPFSFWNSQRQQRRRREKKGKSKRKRGDLCVYVFNNTHPPAASIIASKSLTARPVRPFD